MKFAPRLMLFGGRTPAAAPAAAELAPFDPAARGTWAWTQPARLRPAWILAANGTPVATLELRGAFQFSAHARVAGGAWTFVPKFRGDVLALAGDAAAPAVRYRPGWFAGGRLEREGRETLLWRRENMWRLNWGVFTADKLPLIHLQPRHAAFRIRRECGVELEDAARRLDDLPLLLALGWFLALRMPHSHGAGG